MAPQKYYPKSVVRFNVSIRLSSKCLSVQFKPIAGALSNHFGKDFGSHVQNLSRVQASILFAKVGFSQKKMPV